PEFVTYVRNLYIFQTSSQNKPNIPEFTKSGLYVVTNHTNPTYVSPSSQPIRSILCSVHRYYWHARTYHRLDISHNLPPAKSIPLPADPSKNGTGTTKDPADRLYKTPGRGTPTPGCRPAR